MIDAKHLYFTVGVSSTVLFFLSEINCFLKTLSSFCIFEKALFLDPRSSNVSSIEAWGSSLEVRVLSFNLLLSGTVHPILNQWLDFLLCFWPSPQDSHSKSLQLVVCFRRRWMFFRLSFEILRNSAALTLSKLRRQTSSCSGLQQWWGGGGGQYIQHITFPWSKNT